MDNMAIAIPAIFLVCIIIFVQPFWGMFFVLLLSPIKTSGDEVLLAAKFFGILTLLVVLARQRKRSQSIRWSGMEGPVLLMAAGMSISLVRTTNVVDVVYSLLSLFSLYGLLLLCLNLVNDQVDLKKLIFIFLVSGIYPIVMALLQRGQDDLFRTYTRVSGTFAIATGLSGFLIPVVILALVLTLYPHFSRLTHLFLLMLFGSAMMALVLTLSRGALFGTVLGIMLIIATFGSQSKYKLFTKAIILFMVMGAIWSAWPSVKGRIISPVLDYFSGETSMVTVSQRVDEMSLIIAITVDNSFMGTGIGNYRQAINRYRVIFDAPNLPPVPHNIFLYFFGMVGIVGAIGFLWLLSRVVRSILSAYPSMVDSSPDLASYVFIGSVGSLIGYIPVILTHNGLFGNEMWLALAFLLITIRLRAETPRNVDSNIPTGKSKLPNFQNRRNRPGGL